MRPFYKKSNQFTDYLLLHIKEFLNTAAMSYVLITWRDLLFEEKLKASVEEEDLPLDGPDVIIKLLNSNRNRQ